MALFQSARINEIARSYPPSENGQLISVLEGVNRMLLSHWMDIAQYFHDSIAYIEFMMRNQLKAAVRHSLY